MFSGFNICRDRTLVCSHTNFCNMENFVETEKILKKKFRVNKKTRSRQRVLNGLIDLVATRRVNVATYFKRKRFFDVATKIFKS